MRDHASESRLTTDSDWLVWLISDDDIAPTLHIEKWTGASPTRIWGKEQRVGKKTVINLLSEVWCFMFWKHSSIRSHTT